MEFKHLRIERAEATAIITMARPERRNALSIAMMEELNAAFIDIGKDRGIRAVVLAADGYVFSSGHDLSELRDRRIEDYRRVFDTCISMMNSVQQIPQPVIAEVGGLATAAGCQLAATCDLVVASENAKFATPGVKIGLFCSTPMVALSRSIGRKRALQMLMTGTAVDARTAADWGLVNEVVDSSRLRESSLVLACQIATASLVTLGIGKQAFYSQIELDQEKAYQYTRDVMSSNAVEYDAQEGISAFLEKRPPCWKHD